MDGDTKSDGLDRIRKFYRNVSRKFEYIEKDFLLHARYRFFFLHDFAIEKYQMISLFFSMFLYFGNQSFKEINYSNHGILILDGNSKQVAHA